MQTIEAEKARLRGQFRALRDSLDPALRAAHDALILDKLRSLPELARTSTVFSYIASGSEVETRGLIDALLYQGIRVLVPKSGPKGRMTAYLFKNWTEIVAGQFGIPEPKSTLAYAGKIDACITPGLAFTTSGIRLGQGMGYYDRWFASHKVRWRIALAYESQIADELPAINTDTRVNIIITERRVIRVS